MTDTKNRYTNKEMVEIEESARARADELPHIKLKDKWYGKIAFRGEGVIDHIEGSKEVCEAYVKGWNRAIQEIEAGGEDNPLEDYVTGVDQLEMVDE